MIDFSQLKAPDQTGEVLVVPEARQWSALAAASHAALSRTSATLLGEPLEEWRRRTREALGGCPDRFIVVTGHQPDFIHAGVWAKNVVAHRAAQALDGLAVNLVVDHDTPKSISLSVPSLSDRRITAKSFRFADIRPGLPFEEIPPCRPADIDAIERPIREFMGKRYDSSVMPLFFRGLRAAIRPRDLVEQMVDGRKTIESAFGFSLTDLRVGETAMTSWFAETLLNADRFRDSYNESLDWYRKLNRVRSSGRPIPDLERVGGRMETAWWVHRQGGPRRRLFIERSGEFVRLYADTEDVSSLSTSELVDAATSTKRLSEWGGWQVRPRALTLTLWARLFLADLFIHGIGGAKYDRITDRIIAGYFGMEPPAFTCVSGTLRLDLPGHENTSGEVPALTKQLRDIRYNPQRFLTSDPRHNETIRQRAHAIRHSAELREREPANRTARRAAYDRVRALNAALAASEPTLTQELIERLAEASKDTPANRILTSREHFFALHDRSALESFLAALPAEAAFRV